MATRHAKSPCCRERVRRFGKRRRQCSRCKRTWRVRKKRFGRKRSRVSKFLLARILLEHHTLTQEAKRLGVAQSVASKRMRLALLSVVSRQFHISPRGRCILLADGLYFRFKREHIVMYLMALRPTKSSQAYFLDPVFVKGRERLEAWREALEHIPLPIKKRIVAFVSDGFRGGAALAQEHGWVQQRCHFHMLAALSRKRDGRFRTPSAPEECRNICASMRSIFLRTFCHSARTSLTPNSIFQLRRMPSNPWVVWCARRHAPPARLSPSCSAQRRSCASRNRSFAMGIINQVNAFIPKFSANAA